MEPERVSSAKCANLTVTAVVVVASVVQVGGGVTAGRELRAS